MEYPHTAMGRVQFQVSLPGFRGRKSKKRKSFSTLTSVFPCQCDSTNFRHQTYEKVKVKQSRYRPGVAQRVPGS